MADSWVELRVHGVSGAPPETMLDGARARQVAGDEFGRLFRPVDDRGVEIPGPDGQAVEAYHWGRFTSGSWSQALWLVLMPFGLVNAAQFMLDPPTTTAAKAGHAVAGSMLRLVGLALTVLIVLGAAVIAMDLWAWQQVGHVDGFPYNLVPLVALLAPALTLLVCNYLGRSRLVGGSEAPVRPPVERGRRARLAGQSEEAAGMPGAFWDRDLPSDLVRPGFFGGDPDAPALRLLHVAAGLLVVAVLGFGPGGTSWSRGLALALLGVVVLVVVLLGDPEESASVDVGSRALRRLKDAFHQASLPMARALTGLAAAAFVSAAVRVAVLPPVPGGTAHWPGIDEAVYVALVAGVGGLAVLAPANLLVLVAERRSPARANPRFAPYAGGFACTLLTALGLFFGVGFTAAFAAAAAQVLGGGGIGGGDVRVPELFSRVVYSWGVTTALIVLLAGVGALVWQAQRGAFERRATQDFTRDRGLRVPPRWVGHIAFGMWVARLKNHLVALLVLVTGVGAVFSVFTVVELWPLLWGGEPVRLPGWLDLVSQSQVHGGAATGLVLWVGTLTLTGIAGALVVLGRSALLGESTRRTVNVVWDIFSFWPRAVHPFVPPAYSQRAVPDLGARIRWHLDPTPPDPTPPDPTPPDPTQSGPTPPDPTQPDPPAARDLVLCGHSQGSLLAFAALLRFTGTEPDRALLDRVGLLTFGSQLQVMFSRAFPAYVNERAIAALFAQLGGAWRNLYRDTDPIAGPVLSWRHSPPSGARWFGWDAAEAAVPPVVDLRDGAGSRQEFGPDWRLLDPPLPDQDPQRSPLDALRRHGDFWDDGAWRDAVTQLRRAPAREPAPDGL